MEHLLHTGFCFVTLMTFVNKVTASKVVDHPILTLLALHAAHPFRDFLCALCGIGFE